LIAHRIAYFISPHGFGHAARASAVMAELHKANSSWYFEIFTRVPRWFFADSLGGSFSYHSLITDVGLQQLTATSEDLPRTIERLSALVPFRDELVAKLAKQIKRLGCELVLCDIAPLGIAVGQAANLPTVLVENFTWDWIYQGYLQAENRFAEYIAYLRGAFRRTKYHVQTEPVCRYTESADLLTSPVARTPRTSRAKIRAQLGIPRNSKMVLVTMGGIRGQYEFVHRLEEQRGVHFIIPGSERRAKRGNVILLPHRSEFYHPDLVNASDTVVGKLGYSTVSEVYQAGIPFFYVARPMFRESKVMERFVRKQMHGALIADDEFQNGDWLHRLDAVLALPRINHKEVNGAVSVARFVSGL
jgi:hypothetical protein